jgi:hypothetical protein
MQPVLVPDFLDQLGFLVTKILSGDSYSIYTVIKDMESLSPHFPDFSKITILRVDDRRDAAHVRQ